MTLDPTDKNIEIISNAIYQVIKNRAPENALSQMLDVKPNPFKQQCYVATALLYEYFNGQRMTLYKKKDLTDQYHWWIKTDADITIDITAEQYLIEGLESPSSNYEGSIKDPKLMWFPSYKKRIKKLKEELTDYIKKNNISVAI